MTGRHTIAEIFICALMLWPSAGSEPAASWASEIKETVAAPSVAVAGAPETKPDDDGAVPEKKPTPAVVPVAKPAPADASDTKGYTYNATGKTDPFKPFIEADPAVKKQVQTDKKKGAPKGRPLSPLQQAEIEQFRLVGIAGNSERRTAVVEERASKKFYPLSVGTYIGPNGGRVAQILPDRVVVEERVVIQEKSKKSQIKRIPLLLHPEP